tara:strand:- start:1249 stop:1695 length:447 start_codon:yes stop_codon:yes gene_type:complete
MANHLRRQIRERAATTLTGLTTTGSNVFQSRVYPMESAGLPGLCIYTTEETVEMQSMGGTRNVSRDLTLIVEGYATDSANVDDTLDQIGKEVEIAMSGDIKLNNLAQDSYLSSVEITLSGDGSTGIGKITHSYIVIYQNAENAPDSAL